MPTSAGSELDIAQFLADHPLSELLPIDVREALAEVAEVIEVAAGQTMMVQGEPGDAGYLVATGRLRAVVDGRVVGTIGPGETVGEMALLTGEPRSATVMARRPSTLIRIGADDFLRVLSDHPQTHRALSGLLVQRLDRALTGRTLTAAFATVIAVTGHEPAVASDLVARLSVAMNAMGVRVGVTDGSLSGLTGLEAANDVVLVDASTDDLVVNQAWFDRSLMAVAVSTAPPGDQVLTAATDVVFIQPDAVTLPSGTKRLLGDRPDLEVHHLRLASERDMARLSRRLLGRQRVLVLGGGGARGLAHLGTYQALDEAGIDVDAVIGVSAGAMFGAAVALDWSPNEAIARSSRNLIEAGRLIDFTIPLVALSSGRRITETLQVTYGTHVDLEDLWRPMTILSADLTTLSLRLHRRGSLWRALRASVAVPGVFPPMVEGDAVLVDGGTIDNLPVATARRLYPGATIISSDVGRRTEVMTFDLPDSGIVGGWQSLWDRFRWGRRMPSVVRLLYRLTALGGGATDLVVGDIHVEHKLGGVGMFDFARSRPAIEAGYQATKAVLETVDLEDV